MSEPASHAGYNFHLWEKLAATPRDGSRSVPRVLRAPAGPSGPSGLGDKQQQVVTSLQQPLRLFQIPVSVLGAVNTFLNNKAAARQAGESP